MSCKGSIIETVDDAVVVLERKCKRWLKKRAKWYVGTR